MITVPALMHAGLPVHLALGTNKLQSSFGTSVAVARYWKAGLISKGQVQAPVLWTLFGAALGARCVGAVGDEVLRRCVPILLIGVALYMVLSPRLSAGRSKDARETGRCDDTAGQEARSAMGFGVLAGSVLGFYDGFFGPGTGAFWTVAWMTSQSLDLMRATAATKVVNLASNIASLVVFLFADQVRWDCAGAMIAGQLLGARLGSGLVITKGAALIRPIFTVVVVALAARLLMR